MVSSLVSPVPSGHLGRYVGVDIDCGVEYVLGEIFGLSVWKGKAEVEFLCGLGDIYDEEIDPCPFGIVARVGGVVPSPREVEHLNGDCGDVAVLFGGKQRPPSPEDDVSEFINATGVFKLADVGSTISCPGAWVGNLAVVGCTDGTVHVIDPVKGALGSSNTNFGYAQCMWYVLSLIMSCSVVLPSSCGSYSSFVMSLCALCVIVSSCSPAVVASGLSYSPSVVAVASSASAASTTLFGSLSDGGRLLLWDASHEKPFEAYATIPEDTLYNALDRRRALGMSWCPGSAHLVACYCDSGVSIWDLRQKKQVMKIDATTYGAGAAAACTLTSMQWHLTEPSSMAMCSTRMDGTHGTLSGVDLRAPQRVAVQTVAADGPCHLRWCPDDKSLVATVCPSTGSMTVWSFFESCRKVFSTTRDDAGASLDGMESLMWSVIMPGVLYGGSDQDGRLRKMSMFDGGQSEACGSACRSGDYVPSWLGRRAAVEFGVTDQVVVVGRCSQKQAQARLADAAGKRGGAYGSRGQKDDNLLVASSQSIVSTMRVFKAPPQLMEDARDLVGMMLDDAYGSVAGKNAMHIVRMFPDRDPCMSWTRVAQPMQCLWLLFDVMMQTKQENLRGILSAFFGVEARCDMLKQRMEREVGEALSGESDDPDESTSVHAVKLSGYKNCDDGLVSSLVACGRFAEAASVLQKRQRYGEAVCVATCSGDPALVSHAVSCMIRGDKKRSPILVACHLLFSGEIAALTSWFCPKDWARVVVLCCTYVSGSEFAERMIDVGTRLERASMYDEAALVFLVAGCFARVVRVWRRGLGQCPLADRPRALCGIVRRAVMCREVLRAFSVPLFSLNASLSADFVLLVEEYVMLLVREQQPVLAMRFLGAILAADTPNTPRSLMVMVNESAHFRLGDLAERIYVAHRDECQAGGIPRPPGLGTRHGMGGDK